MKQIWEKLTKPNGPAHTLKAIAMNASPRYGAGGMEGWAMSSAVKLREDYSAEGLRALARRSKDDV
jgi:hypothetical protein